MLWLDCVLLALLLVQEIQTEATGVVQTSHGPVQGQRETYKDGRMYEKFLGVPFGAPTGGDNRFELPVEPVSWTEVLDCSEYRAYCPQFVTKLHPLIDIVAEHSEDCLHLNIYVPEDREVDEKLPVMFFIYGGAFLVGCSDMYPGESLAVNGRVIVVTINYRIGTLGWLSTGDKNAEGNMGLWDDALALQWVNDNIENFGGDKDRITVFGQSAGAVSADHLLLSHQTRHLFKRMIAISGAATMYIANTPFYEESARSLALLNLCPIFSYYRMVECLKEKGPVRLDLLGMVTPVVFGNHLPNWVPMIDGEFVPQLARTTLEEGVSADHDIMLGSTHDDGAGFILTNIFGMGYGNLLNLARSKKLINLVVDMILNVYANPEELKELVVERYPDYLSDDMDTRTRATSQMLTDYFFGSPATYEALVHSSFSGGVRGKTYLYEFSYRQSFQKYPSWVNGSHIDDLYSIFGEDFMEPFRRKFLRREWNDDDRKVSKYIQSYYANFAYTGDPNDGPHEVPTYWPQFNGETRQYLEQTPAMEVKTQDAEKIANYAFWNEEYYNSLKRKTSWRTFTAEDSDITNFEEGMMRVAKFEKILELVESDPEAAATQFFYGIQQLLESHS